MRFRSKKTPACGTQASIRRFRWDRRPTISVSACLGSAETQETLSPTPLIRTKLATGCNFRLWIETTTNLIVNALVIMAGGLTVVLHQFLIQIIMPTGMQTPMRPPGMSCLPACWWNSTNAIESCIGTVTKTRIRSKEVVMGTKDAIYRGIGDTSTVKPWDKDRRQGNTVGTGTMD